MKQFIGLIFLLALQSTALSQTYVGVGAGVASGDGWNGNSSELFLGHSFKSRFGFEAGIYDLGLRDRWRDEEAKGFSMEAGYSFKFINEKNYITLSGGTYLYRAEFHTGDAYAEEFGMAPVLSVSTGYSFENNLSARLKYSNFFRK